MDLIKYLVCIKKISWYQVNVYDSKFIVCISFFFHMYKQIGKLDKNLILIHQPPLTSMIYCKWSVTHPAVFSKLNPVWHEGMVMLSPFCNTTTLSSQIQKPEFWSFHIRYWKKFVKDVSNLASFYGSHIDGIVCVKQIDLG